MTGSESCPISGGHGTPASGPPGVSGGPVISLLATGGTISMRPSAAGGLVPRARACHLVEGISAHTEVEVRARDLGTRPGAHTTIDDVSALVGEIDAEIRHGASGVVVTLGTDTLEEVAFMIDHQVDAACPVVLTGAMRPPDAPGADGAANLLAALAIAADPASKGRGVLVTLSDVVHCARFVEKRHASSVAAFASPGCGPIGHVVEGRPRYSWYPEPRAALPHSTGPWPATPIVVAGIDDRGEALAHASGWGGCVVEAFGVGHLPPAMLARATALGAKIPVVVTSRTRSGDLFAATYSFPGSERDVCRAPLISGHGLGTIKARLALMIMLAAGYERDQITSWFASGPTCPQTAPHAG